jgi:hypothetical protein
MIYNNRSEKGQAIVMLAIAIVVLLAFVALAIDGGMAFSDRRQAQNGSDASSLAGAGAAALELEQRHVRYEGWKCTSSDVLETMEIAAGAAQSRAASNGYFIDDDLEDLNGVSVECEPGFFNGAWVEKYLEVTTLISDTTDTSFAHLIFSGLLQNNVHAQTRVYPRSSLAYGNAVVALNDNLSCSGNDGVVIGGSQDVIIDGGGIFSNSCMKCNGNKPIIVTPPDEVHNMSNVPAVNCENMDPAPENAAFQLPDIAVTIPPPDCSAPGAFNYSTEFKVTNNEHEELDPGLHCFNASPNALTVTGGTLIGHNVTIYAPNGSISVSGGTVTLTAPANSDYEPAIPNVLMYTEESGNRGEISLVGNGGSLYVGTIYAPKSLIKITGNSDTDAFNTQLIGWDVNISGDAVVRVQFNEKQNYSRPAVLELFK